MACAKSSGPHGRSAVALDLHEGISHPRPIEEPGGCPRWPEHLRLRSSHGELVRGRCRSTNLCAYCAKLGAVENAELLALDALAGSAPEVWIVLTTREPVSDPKPFYRSREVVLRAIRRRWPDAEYAALVEFTTGYGPAARGKRRPHWNLLVKGVPRSDLDALAEVVRRVWCRREDAEPWAQFVGEVEEVGGLMRYLALHFQKESQAPPPGWRGHRFLKSRGYLATSTPIARERAKDSLAFKRELWRAIRGGLRGERAERAAQAARALAAETSWALVTDWGSVAPQSARGPACGATRPTPARSLPSQSTPPDKAGRRAGSRTLDELMHAGCGDLDSVRLLV